MTGTHPTTTDPFTDVTGYMVVQIAENNNPVEIPIAVILGVDNYIEALRIQKEVVAEAVGNEAAIREISGSAFASTEREDLLEAAGLY